ncbi:MAG: tautomerase family protein [Lachnospiraceae bacterium]|jgi:Trk K+ transport system NAD-binding subunit|nr:tautomerase family protein [Lachnospiraceae bacterium]
MPLIKVDLNRKVFAKKGQELSDAIHEGLVTGLGIEDNDIFHVFTPHDEEEIIFSADYDNRDRRDLITIQIIMVKMFSEKAKKSALKDITRNIINIGIRRDDILICMLENPQGNWSLGEKEV